MKFEDGYKKFHPINQLDYITFHHLIPFMHFQNKGEMFKQIIKNKVFGKIKNNSVYIKIAEELLNENISIKGEEVDVAVDRILTNFNTYNKYFSVYFDLITIEGESSITKGRSTMNHDFTNDNLLKLYNISLDTTEKTFEIINKKLNLQYPYVLKKDGVGENNNLFLDEYFDNENIIMAYLNKELMGLEVIRDLYKNSEIIMVYKYIDNGTKEKIYYLTEFLTITYTIRSTYSNGIYDKHTILESFNKLSLNEFLTIYDFQYKLNIDKIGLDSFIGYVKSRIEQTISYRTSEKGHRRIDSKVADSVFIAKKDYFYGRFKHEDSKMNSSLFVYFNHADSFTADVICEISFKIKSYLESKHIISVSLTPNKCPNTFFESDIKMEIFNFDFAIDLNDNITRDYQFKTNTGIIIEKVFSILSKFTQLNNRYVSF